MQWLVLFLGGGIGAVLRVGIGTFVQVRSGGGFPWGTFAVNVLGCFAIGLVWTWLDESHADDSTTRMFLLPGLLGGFTTFSSFGLETFRLFEEAQYVAAAGNALGSVAACLCAVVIGVALGRAI